MKHLVALLLALVLCLSGVGSGVAESKGEIVFWNFFTGPDGKTMQELIDGFNATNPDYVIKGVTMEGGDLYAKLPNVVMSGEGIPDLCLNHYDRVGVYARQGMLEPIDSLVAYQPDLKAENYISTAWGSGSIDGVQYSIPLDIGATALHYNVDLVNKYCPEIIEDGIVTFEEMLSAIPAASADGIVTMGNYFFWEVAMALALSDGFVPFNEDGTANANSESVIKAFNAIKEIVDQGGCTLEGDEVFQMFVSGEIMFITTGVWDANALNSYPELNWAILPPMTFDAEKTYSWAASNQFVLLKNDARTDEQESVIADFLNYIRENAIIWAGSGMIPASHAADEDPNFHAMKQYALVATEDAASGLYFNTDRNASYFSGALSQYCNDIAYGYITAEEAVELAQKEIEDNIAQNIG